MPGLLKVDDPAMKVLPIRAAQYVRASTEHQQYSIDNQSAAIEGYATVHNMQVVQTYADEGRSGLTLQNRKGLLQLLQDVEKGGMQFSIILVYDVSRWGRFQDVDESAYYEYRCKRAKMEIHYCAEQFANDGSISSALLKTLKRTMAGEFSRELSTKVFAGKCRLVERGFRQGGRPGYGMRRLLVDRDGKQKGLLNPGERKSITTDRVILVPGPPEEVKVVRDIYRQYTEEHKCFRVIAEQLNDRSIGNESGGLWTKAMVAGLLTNPKYIGTNVTNRTSFKLKAKNVINPPEMWVRRDGAFQPLVDAAVFKKAQEEFAATCRRYTNEELLELLKRLLSQTGELSTAVIDNTLGMPCTRLYHDRFGSLLEAYRRIGYSPSQDFSYLRVNVALQVDHEERITRLIADLESAGATVYRSPNADLLTINEELRVRYLTVRCCRAKRSEHRWFFRFDAAVPYDITIAARMNPQNQTVLDYFLVPRFENVPSQIYSGAISSVLNIYRFGDLSVLKTLVRRTQFTEEA
jgi:DNA invertase Pin-like site-specific DNA recombinase